MGRRALSVLLVTVPAAALGALGIVVVASATAQQGATMYGVAAHFAARQVFALILAALVAIAFVQLGARRVLRAAPFIFVVALGAVMAVFAPGVGSCPPRPPPSCCWSSWPRASATSTGA
jgi:cell division protein FtsW (lipid II flippase)